MIGYYENRSKIILNSNFVFEKSRIGKLVGMTGKLLPKPVNRSTMVEIRKKPIN
jgi:hypothetical protein